MLKPGNILTVSFGGTILQKLTSNSVNFVEAGTSTTALKDRELRYDAMIPDLDDFKPQCSSHIQPAHAHTGYISITIEIVKLEHVI